MREYNSFIQSHKQGHKKDTQETDMTVKSNFRKLVEQYPEPILAALAAIVRERSAFCYISAEMRLQTETARKPADFPHRQHQQKYSCTVCHHANDEVMVIKKCASCHTLDISNPNVNSYKKASHKLCKDCHKAVNSAEGKDAPIKCSGCHMKKE